MTVTSRYRRAESIWLEYTALPTSSLQSATRFSKSAADWVASSWLTRSSSRAMRSLSCPIVRPKETTMAVRPRSRARTARPGSSRRNQRRPVPPSPRSCGTASRTCSAAGSAPSGPSTWSSSLRVSPNSFDKAINLSVSGTAASASHLLTAWRDTPSLSPRASWDNSSRRRCS